jgi:cobalt-zinc-cadmium efflux system outer membrane protein
MKRIWVGMIVVIALAAAGSGMTLDGAVERALRENPELAGAFYQWEAARTVKTRETSLPDPTLEFAFGASGADLEGDLRTLAIGQALPFPTKILKSRSRAGSMELAAGARYESAKRRLIADVKQAYVDLVAIDEKIRIYEDDLSDVRVLEEAIRRRYEVGRAAQHDLVKAEIEVLLVENRLEVLRMDTRVAAAERMRALLGVGGYEPLNSPVRLEVDFSLVDVDSARKAGVSGAPELRTRSHLTEAARADISLARMEWIPDLKLRFFLDERDMAMGRNRARGLMLLANLPIWVWRTQAMVREKNAALERVGRELESTRDALETELESRLASFSTTRASHALFEGAVIPEAELASEIA